MSKDLPQQPNSEEVDLGQLFKLIGNAFNRFFRFIGKIFYGLFLAFVWLVFFFKKHAIIIGIAAILGFGYGYANQKLSEPIYKASVVVKQNYGTGENLFSLINRYNDLISERDSVTLGQSLQISPQEANSIVEFNLETVLDDNQKLRLYNNYIKEIDSTIAVDFDFEQYLKSTNEYDFRIQRITVKSKSKNIFEKILIKVVENVESSEYFINEQKKDLAELFRREDIIKESLKESDSLQKVYQEVLEKSAERVAGSQTTVTIDNTEDKSITKEFELFNKDLELRRELVQIERRKEDLEHIVEIISTEQNSGTLERSKQFLGISFGIKLYYGIAFVFIAVIVLMSLEFLKYLERFRDKI